MIDAKQYNKRQITSGRITGIDQQQPYHDQQVLPTESHSTIPAQQCNK